MKTALITGGTGALGQAVVKFLLEHQIKVHATWVSDTEKDALIKETIQHKEFLRLHSTDVTRDKAVTALAQAIIKEDGRIDILANLVGGFAYANIEETDEATWHHMIEMNATSCFVCTRAVVPQMKQQRYGRIINVAAQPALGRGAAQMSAYSASKAAVLNLTQSLSQELIKDGITVNAIVPTIIDTPANRKTMPTVDKTHWLLPTDIANVVGFLMSDEAKIVTGTAVNLSV